MRVNTIVGGIIITILLVSVVYAFASPIISGPIFLTGDDKARVTIEYSLNSTQMPGISYVNLNFTLKSGGIEVNFTDDIELIYKFVFRQDPSVGEPNITNIKLNSELLVDVMAESGDVRVTLGSNYIYNCNMSVGAGGVAATLSNSTNLGYLNLIVTYAGGVSVDILDEASFDFLNLMVNTGGVRLHIDANSLGKNCSVYSEVKVGGMIVDSLLLGTDLGCRVRASVDIGGIFLNTVDFTKIEESANKVEIISSNYTIASTKIDIDVFLGLGGGMVNENPFFTFPTGFG
ncbi:MAG: hypothetical protein HXX80_00295 [Nitrososphaerales archaeon]|nr:hypothetical protein [Nitrososphaerales archaeon]